MKVSATLKGQPDGQGRYAIYIRVNDGKHRITKATKYRVLSTEFEKGKVINHGQADMINAALRVMIAKQEIGESKTYPDSDFKKYVDDYVDEVKQERDYETLRQYKSELSKIQGFRSSFRLSQVTPEFLKNYSTYCYGLGNMSNTVWKTFKFLRLMIRKAVKEKVIAENPFDIYKMPKYKDPKKIYLTKDQVNLIEGKLPEMADLRHTATWFVIGCYTGLRFGDMNAFNKKSNIKNNRLVMYTGKTGEVISMPVSDRLKNLFESVGNKALNKKNNHANDELRGILSFCEIREPITFHSSRHTFAIMCAEAGISQEVTAKLLGHRDLKTTAVYYKITNPRIDAEIGRIG